MVDAISQNMFVKGDGLLRKEFHDPVVLGFRQCHIGHLFLSPA